MMSPECIPPSRVRTDAVAFRSGLRGVPVIKALLVAGEKLRQQEELAWVRGFKKKTA